MSRPYRARFRSVRSTLLPQVEALESRALLSANPISEPAHRHAASHLTASSAGHIAFHDHHPRIGGRHHQAHPATASVASAHAASHLTAVSAARMASHDHHAPVGGRHHRAHPSTDPVATVNLVHHPVGPLARHRRIYNQVPSYSGPYSPSQIRHAYGVDQLSLNGAGQTIAIIDAYDDPTIAYDLHVFDQTFGLPDPTFVKVTPMGVPRYDSGWAAEIALDVEWAHAMAPGATILLVEAPSASLTDLLSAVNYAVSAGAKQISMSWAGSDFVGEQAFDAYFQYPGVTFLAASGDNGAGASYPAASPFVTAVGGTSLQTDAFGNRVFESAWSGSGGGTSIGESRPGYQWPVYSRGWGRALPDVSFNADPNAGYYTYDSSSGGGWTWVGGTSAGTPQWAGLIAMANQGRASLGKLPVGSGFTYGTNQMLYILSSYGGFLDITTGSNGYPATVGYDRVTGLGSPIANVLVPQLVYT